MTLKYKNIDHEVYKFEVTEPYVVYAPQFKDAGFSNEYFVVFNGLILIRAGYAWDGASGIAINTENSRLASLVHDVLYQAIQEGLLTKDDRKAADVVLREFLILEGMSKFRAYAWYYAVRLFGGLYSK